MAIKLQHVVELTARLQVELDQLKTQEADDLTSPDRWALFVTPRELNALMDEAAEIQFFPEGTMTTEEEAGIRTCRGLLRINGIAIFPELQERAEALDG